MARPNRKKPSPPVISQPTSESSIVPRGLRVQEAARYLGVAVYFVRNAVWKKDLPAMKLGRRLIIAREDLDRFLDRQKMEAAA